MMVFELQETVLNNQMHGSELCGGMVDSHFMDESIQMLTGSGLTALKDRPLNVEFTVNSGLTGLFSQI